LGGVLEESDGDPPSFSEFFLFSVVYGCVGLQNPYGKGVIAKIFFLSELAPAYGRDCLFLIYISSVAVWKIPAKAKAKAIELVASPVGLRSSPSTLLRAERRRVARFVDGPTEVGPFRRLEPRKMP
jgi:hypothetical protein